MTLEQVAYINSGRRIGFNLSDPRSKTKTIFKVTQLNVMHAKIREKFYMNMNTTALPVSNKLFYSCFIKAQELKKIENKFVFQEIFLEEVEWK